MFREGDRLLAVRLVRRLDVGLSKAKCVPTPFGIVEDPRLTISLNGPPIVIYLDSARRQYGIGAFVSDRVRRSSRHGLDYSFST